MKAVKFLFIFFPFAGPVCYAQDPCPPIKITYKDTCFNKSVQLHASPGFSIYSWTPSKGLSEPDSADPIATRSGYYIVTGVNLTGPNLVVNPDFGAGNTGFTSGLTYSTMYFPGNYYVGPQWFTTSIPGLYDHTPGNDNMYMSVDGAQSPVIIWEQNNIVVQPNTNYTFSFWASEADEVQPDFEIHFEGDVSGDAVVKTMAGIPNLTYGVFNWDRYTVPVWNSGSNTNLTIRIINLEIGSYGNDFAMDDFSLNASCFQADSVKISISPPVKRGTNVFTPNDDSFNDFFTLEREDAMEVSLKIYNRWGQMVHETKDLTPGWDGRSNNQHLAEGVYFWILTYKTACSNGNLSENGSVTLIR
jgi:gliding motility-associated-like protein